MRIFTSLFLSCLIGIGFFLVFLLTQREATTISEEAVNETIVEMASEDVSATTAISLTDRQVFAIIIGIIMLGCIAIISILAYFNYQDFTFMTRSIEAAQDRIEQQLMNYR